MVTITLKRWCIDSLQNESFLHQALVGIYFKADGITGFVGSRGNTDVKDVGVIGRNVVAVVQKL